MFGDYEAQRHWQEITLNLPHKEWYTNSTNNDLQYWGLDYPPLTAYHSLLLAYVANKTNPDFVELRRSRGFESDSHKFFMRLSVILADAAVYIPAVFWFVLKLKIGKSSDSKTNNFNIFDLKKRHFILISTLIYPGLILIDHGHFQYNCVSLGLFVAAVTCILQGMVLTGSWLFSLALNYKQMELYHALPFFFYILGNNLSFKKRSVTIRFKRLICVASVVLVTFGIIWSPFLTNIDTLYDAIVRLFPLGRGIFEDKVANVWCAINVLYKLRKGFSDVALAKICLVATLAAVLPSNLNLFLSPTSEKFLLSLINTSLAFFLFSFQVHEKSILLVAVPVLLYTYEDPMACCWFLIISNFSMLHLFVKDNLLIAYVAITIFYLVSILWMFSDVFFDSVRQQESNKSKDVPLTSKSKVDGSKLGSSSKVTEKTTGYYYPLIKLFYISMLGMILLNVGTFALEPPAKYPDLFPVLISLYSCGHFVIFFLYFNYKQFTRENVNKKVKSK